MDIIIKFISLKVKSKPAKQTSYFSEDLEEKIEEDRRLMEEREREMREEELRREERRQAERLGEEKRRREEEERLEREEEEENRRVKQGINLTPFVYSLHHPEEEVAI